MAPAEAAAAAEIEIPSLIELAEAIKELSPEQAGEDLDGEEVPPSGGNPLVAARRQTAASDDAVQVGMQLKASSPGVKNGGEADLRTQAAFIIAEFEQGLRDGLEQQLVERLGVAPAESTQFRRQGEDDVEVAARQDPPLALLDPRRLDEALALGAVAVATGVVGGPRVATRVANVHMPALGPQHVEGALDATDELPADVGVPGRAARRAMAEQLLNNPDIGSESQEVRRECVLAQLAWRAPVVLDKQPRVLQVTPLRVLGKATQLHVLDHLVANQPHGGPSLAVRARR